jgi:hypothetical protein
MKGPLNLAGCLVLYNPFAPEDRQHVTASFRYMRRLQNKLNSLVYVSSVNANAGSQCGSHGSDGPAESFPGDAEEIHPRETQGIAPRNDGFEGGDVIGMDMKGIA